jgi:hypothetical protein
MKPEYPTQKVTADNSFTQKPGVMQDDSGLLVWYLSGEILNA